MSLSLNFYHDQIAAGGATSSALAPAHRLLYVRHGRVAINGRTMNADEAIYCDRPLALTSASDWSQVWRWELAQPDAAAELHAGDGVLSRLRMSRLITSLDLQPGTHWLFRLDVIVHGAGGIADRHQHPGPGIRCLLEGTFNVQQGAALTRDLDPGDAWWETGPDTVVAWGSRRMPAKFLRCTVLPLAYEGKPTGTWLATKGPPPGEWKLHIDRVIVV